MQHPKFSADIGAKIGRVIDIGKLRSKYNTFEAKRQLLAEYDLFMADDRLIASLPGLLGKTFYRNKSKRPIPVRLTAGAEATKDKAERKKKENDDKTIGTPEGVSHEIETALNSTPLNLSATATTSILCLY